MVRNDAEARGSVKPRRQGETQWGAFIDAPEIKNVETNPDPSHVPLPTVKQPSDKADWNMNDHQDEGEDHNTLTPFLEIRERLQRGMYELVYDKPCVRSNVNTRDGSRTAILKPVSQEIQTILLAIHVQIHFVL